MSLLIVLLFAVYACYASATNWFVASPISLNWTASDIANSKVNILLQYEMNSKTLNWSIKTNIDNTGSLHLTSSDFDLSSTASHVNITQNTTGYFIASSSNQSTTASQPIHILQSVLLAKPITGGALYPQITHNKLNAFNVMIANEYCNSTKYTLSASLIHLNTNTLQWNTTNDLEIKRKGDIDRQNNSLYCIVPNVTVQLKKLSITYGGPWYLQIGVTDTTTKYNYYAINHNTHNIQDQLYQFIVYNPANVSIKWDQHSYIQKYDDIPMSVNIGMPQSVSNDIDIYIALTSSTSAWWFNCGEKNTSSYFQSFGWHFLNTNGDKDDIDNGNYTPQIYWAVADIKHEQQMNAFAISGTVDTVRINSSSDIVPGVMLLNDDDFTVHAGDDITVSISSSFNTPINLTISFRECVNKNCKDIGAKYNVLYHQKNQMESIHIPISLESNVMVQNVTTFMNVTTDFCVTKRVSVAQQEIHIIPYYRNYILGDRMENISWNESYFEGANTVTVSLLYRSDTVFDSISLGIVDNNGFAMTLIPDFSTNAKHLWIENNSTGFIQISSANKVVNITSVILTLYQPLSMKQSINGSTIATSNDRYLTTYTISGLIAQSIVSSDGFEFNAYLTNIKDKKSLEFVSTAQYALKISNTTISECFKHDAITYCQYTIEFMDKLNETVNVANTQYGTYLLVINYYKNTPFISNYYVINNFSDYGYYYSPFLLYSLENIKVSFMDQFNQHLWLTSYEHAPMGIDMTHDMQIASVYAVLQDLNSSTLYIFECGAHSPSYYTSFGWRFQSNDTAISNIVNGTYAFILYWNTSTTSFTSQYQLQTYQDTVRIVDVAMRLPDDSKYVDIVHVEVKDNIGLQLVKGNSYTFKFTASLCIGSIIEVYFEQCRNESFELKECVNFYPQNDGKSHVFTFKENGQMEIIKVPLNSSLKHDAVDSHEFATFMVMTVPLCKSSNVITAKQDVAIAATSSSSDDLSAGTIAALICAMILVIALCGWWLCMRNSSGDGYRTLDE